MGEVEVTLEEELEEALEREALRRRAGEAWMRSPTAGIMLQYQNWLFSARGREQRMSMRRKGMKSMSSDSDGASVSTHTTTGSLEMS